jgi:uncharacterized protein YqeY
MYDMSLKQKVMEQLKAAMKNKDKVALESLRAIKSELLLMETSGGNAEISEEQELKLLQKLVKQRKDSAITFTEQGRIDLAEPELAQAKIIEIFLPEQMSEADVKGIITTIIENTGANSMSDMGKVMGIASKELAGKSDGKTISNIVRSILME